MGVIFFLYRKLPRPLFILMVLMFLFTLIVGLGHTNKNHRSPQEKQHGYNHSSAR